MEWKLEDGRKIRLLTIPQFKELKDGTKLIDIFGDEYEVGRDRIDMDTRGGYIAYGFLEK